MRQISLVLSIVMLAGSVNALAAEESDKVNPETYSLRRQFTRIMDVITPDHLPFFPGESTVSKSRPLGLMVTPEQKPEPRGKTIVCSPSNSRSGNKYVFTVGTPSNLPVHNPGSCTGVGYRFSF